MECFFNYFQSVVGWICGCRNCRYEGPTVLQLLFIYLISQDCDGLSQNKRKNLVMALLKNLQFGKHNVKRKKKQVAEVIFTLGCYLYNFKTIKILYIFYGLQTCGRKCHAREWKVENPGEYFTVGGCRVMQMRKASNIFIIFYFPSYLGTAQMVHVLFS